jgi:hypothetical protein
VFDIKDSLWAAFFGGGGLAVAVWKTIDRVVERVMQKASSDAINDMESVYLGLESILVKNGPARVLLLYAANGGGIPTAGVEVKTTILYEVFDRTQKIGRSHTPIAPIRKNWQNVPLDRGYTDLLSTVIKIGQWSGTEAELSPGFLKDMYLDEGVTHAYVAEVRRTRNRYYYIALQWYDSAMVPPVYEVDNSVQIFKNECAPKLRQ